MTDRFPEISRLKQIDANKTELREFAIDQAMSLLINAGVQNVVRAAEVANARSAFEAPQSVRGFFKENSSSFKATNLTGRNGV
jgi:hypothetical protein